MNIAIWEQETFDSTPKDLPLLFIGGDDDPVGSYGIGVQESAAAYRENGSSDVTIRLYHGRHEIHYDYCREEVYANLFKWLGDRDGTKASK